MKTVILCGGQGTRIQEATGGLKPKPMVEVGGRPILWHIMKGYAHFGVKDFILCLGHLGNVIKNYFLHYEDLNSDITVHLGSKDKIVVHRQHSEADWKVTLADTGLDSMTGARLARVRQYIGHETFMFTYGDGVADVDIGKLLKFHRSHGKIATVTGVIPVGRFGRLNTENQAVVSFEEKPADESDGKINGGFFVFEPGVFEYIQSDMSCVLEREPLERLAKNNQLMMYSHEGFWQCMDTYRDLLLLEQLWESGNPPWRLWSKD